MNDTKAKRTFKYSLVCYPSKKLNDSILEIAENEGVSVSRVIQDILTEHLIRKKI